MGRPPLAKCWVDAILQERLEDPEIKAPTIANKLSRYLEAGSLTLTPDAQKTVPDERTIRKELKKLPRLELAETDALSRCKWPESFLKGLLPWEASRAALDLLDLTAKRKWPRPTIEQTKWFWRLTLASKDMPIMLRWEHAIRFASDPELKLDALVRVTEIQLARNDWPSRDEHVSEPSEAPIDSAPQGFIDPDLQAYIDPAVLAYKRNPIKEQSRKGKPNGRKRSTTKKGR